jgi:hypothetical protein
MNISKALPKLGLLLSLLLFGGFAYAGNTGILNDPNILYTGTDPITGKPLVVKGCRPERLQTGGTCDRSFHIGEFLNLHRINEVHHD